jgi:hypothetical protein
MLERLNLSFKTKIADCINNLNYSFDTSCFHCHVNIQTMHFWELKFEIDQKKQGCAVGGVCITHLGVQFKVGNGAPILWWRLRREHS